MLCSLAFGEAVVDAVGHRNAVSVLRCNNCTRDRHVCVLLCGVNDIHHVSIDRKIGFRFAEREVFCHIGAVDIVGYHNALGIGRIQQSAAVYLNQIIKGLALERLVDSCPFDRTVKAYDGRSLQEPDCTSRS